MLSYNYIDQITGETVEGSYKGTGEDPIDDYMNIEMSSNWFYDANDECWHYKYDDSLDIPAAEGTEGYSFSIIETFEFDGERIENDLAGALFNLTILFQAKQAGFVDWETLGTGDLFD